MPEDLSWMDTSDIDELRTMCKQIYDEQQDGLKQEASYLETMNAAVEDLERGLKRTQVYTKASNWTGAAGCAEAYITIVAKALKASLKL